MNLAITKRFFVCCLVFSLVVIVIITESDFFIRKGNVQIESKSETWETMHKYEKRDLIVVDPSQFKKILFWNEAYGGKEYNIGIGKDVFLNAGCPIWQCETYDNRSAIPVHQFDAVLFHLRSFNITDIPVYRRPHQRYILWSIESPEYKSFPTRHLDGFFNWTMTYRWDSDIVQPYGWIEPQNATLPLHPDEKTVRMLMKHQDVDYMNGKSKMVAWFVSNCYSPSNRMNFVNKLKKYVKVDIYGQCGHLKCSRTNEDQCRDMLGKDYKFYLALENSLCRDYVTEKFFTTMNLNVIPIVDSVHGNHMRMAPPHSFIDASSFATVEKLAGYLKLLASNATLYNEYFWWKPYYRVRNGRWENRLPLCELCAKLNTDTLARSYDNMTAWWEVQAQCKSNRKVL